MNLIIQHLITYVLVAIAFGYTAVHLFQILFPKRKNTPACGTTHCAGCDAVELRKSLYSLKKKG